MATTTAPPLPTVTFNRDRSTKYTQVYDAQSRSAPGTLWRVTHDLRTDIWRCPCMAGRHGQPCDHARAAHLHEQEREWRALWATQTPAQLRRAELDYARRLTAGEDVDPIAYDTLADEVARRLAGERAA